MSFGSGVGDEVGAHDVRIFVGGKVVMVGIVVGAGVTCVCVGGTAVRSAVGAGVVAMVAASGGGSVTVQWSRDRRDRRKRSEDEYATCQLDTNARS